MFIVIPSIRAKMSKSNVKNSKSMNSAFIQWNILYGNGNEQTLAIHTLQYRCISHNTGQKTPGEGWLHNLQVPVQIESGRSMFKMREKVF